jgi:hypothetical protein
MNTDGTLEESVNAEEIGKQWYLTAQSFCCYCWLTALSVLDI